MLSEHLQEQLRQFEPLILPLSAEEATRILSRFGNVACDVRCADPNDEERVIAEIGSLLLKAQEIEPAPLLRVFITVVYEALAQKDIRPALVALAEFLGTHTKTRIVIHAGQPSIDWPGIRDFAKQLRETLARPRDVDIQLMGPFAEYAESELEDLFNLGVRIQFAAGWTNGCPPDQFLMVDTKTLRAFSEFGFRTAVHWYAQANNIADFHECIPDILVANYNSGFALPLASENPYYKFGPGYPGLPAAVDYCRLLVLDYQKHPYFDDVLSPLSLLALLVKTGGWHPSLNISTVVQFVVNREGAIGVYRTSPALAMPWMSLSELLAKQPDVLKSSFLELVHENWAWENVPYCQKCRWKHICGGLGAPAESGLSTRVLDTMCEHRKLFLEHFAKARSGDHVIGAPLTT
jgi:hypothetical protein